MSLHDFRRIALAHDLLAPDAPKRPANASGAEPNTETAEPRRECIPAETEAQEGNG